MKIYVVRHGQDDPTVRGGWSSCPLTPIGIRQSEELAEKLASNFCIGRVCSSDLLRARQTAEIIARRLNLPVEPMAGFREVNNGSLAGLDNAAADKKYPGLYWKSLGFSEHYPNGESPKEFYERVSLAYESFVSSLTDCDSDTVLVTHGGVINVISSIVQNEPYSNQKTYPKIPCAEIAMEIEV